jgi:aminoglycoside 6'-N-acetyltransferase I
MIIRPATISDASGWEALRRDLWPEDPESHAPEIARFFAGTLEEPQAVLLAFEGNLLIAFAELSIRRDLSEIGQLVGYVEGLYIAPDWRGRGIARRLLVEAKAWAQRSACDAFASDRADRIIVDPRYSRASEGGTVLPHVSCFSQ